MPAETTGADGTQADPTTQPQAGTDSPSQAEGAREVQAASATDGSGTGQPDMATLQRGTRTPWVSSSVTSAASTITP